TALDQSPEAVNADPYEDCWLFRVKPIDDDLSQLLDADAYDVICEDE
ncbi:MAG TPA: glycine cleavage system protein H, partial [Armatimonadetes bacterium]|nr:glycine cleavage system protein H [Armatimonadota bacterium]